MAQKAERLRLRVPEGVLDPTERRARSIIDHRLKNTGEKPIVTDFYNHNFFNVDGDPVGPNYSFAFPFEVKAKDLKGKFGELVELKGNELRFKDKLTDGFVMAGLTGFDPEDETHREFGCVTDRAAYGRRVAQLPVLEVQHVGRQDDNLPGAVHGDRLEAR